MGMNLSLQDRVRTALNQELIRRLLNKYFVNKGFSESLDKRIYPPILQDIVAQIPQLYGKVEIVPSVEDIDPNTGVVKLNWNLFILGNSRMFLGSSSHTNLAEVRTAMISPLSSGSRQTYATPRRIIEFVSKVLGKSKSGDISVMPRSVMTRDITASPFSTGDQSGYFRTQHRPVF
jgi:hypothetical protein